VQVKEPTFDFSGGEPCLDFANTVGGRGRDQPREGLGGYAELVSWGEQAGLVTGSEKRRLLQEAADRQAEAATVLKRATGLREAIYRAFSALVNGRSTRPADLATLNAELSMALARLRLVPGPDGLGWDWAADDRALDGVIWSVAHSAAELLTSERLDRVRECAESRCGWLFLDASRNRSRQWCDMKVCGNRAKARRHHARKKATAR